MKLKLCNLFLFLFLYLSGSAHAYTLEPSVTVLSMPVDAGGATLVLRNPRDTALPVIFEVAERTINEDGSELATPSDDRFIVFPPQVVVQPGQAQSIRIQWAGGALDQSKSFTLYASEQPLKIEQPTHSGVKTLFRIGASIHVTAEQFSPKVVVSDHEVLEDGTSVTLSNGGDEFVYIDDLSLRLDKINLSGFQLAKAAGRTLLPPGGKRTFTIPELRAQPLLQEK
uniref:fimbria/pilus periplasmic chaperone n=1 Tax=Microbulbifer agarilyticus TaxID=260552 RepID=UPI000255AA5D|nr:fimbria/pilus periplasmic chaperone [Microbulbifer agarilyticus]